MMLGGTQEKKTENIVNVKNRGYVCFTEQKNKGKKVKVLHMGKKY